jgi:hypothetical protein
MYRATSEVETVNRGHKPVNTREVFTDLHTPVDRFVSDIDGKKVVKFGKGIEGFRIGVVELYRPSPLGLGEACQPVFTAPVKLNWRTLLILASGVGKSMRTYIPASLNVCMQASWFLSGKTVYTLITFTPNVFMNGASSLHCAALARGSASSDEPPGW